jgi:tetratricopeptide (TPR) repeat protein
MLSLVLAGMLSGNAELVDLDGPAKSAAAESSSEGLLREAKTLRYAQRWFEAAQRYRAYIAQHPNSGRLADARFWLAATLEQNQQWDEAAKAYGEFLELHGDQRLLCAEAKLNRIHCWGMRKGQSPDSIPGLAAALADPTDEVQVAAALELAQCKDPRSLPALKKGLALPAYADACSLAMVSMGVKPEAAARQARFLVIRIKESGKPEVVTIRLALALARAVGSYLSDAQVQQAKTKGYDVENLMDQAGKLPKGSLLFSVEDKNSSVTITVE